MTPKANRCGQEWVADILRRDINEGNLAEMYAEGFSMYMAEKGMLEATSNESNDGTLKSDYGSTGTTGDRDTTGDEDEHSIGEGTTRRDSQRRRSRRSSFIAAAANAAAANIDDEG
jgi:hypothetical protein